MVMVQATFMNGFLKMLLNTIIVVVSAALSLGEILKEETLYQSSLNICDCRLCCIFIEHSLCILVASFRQHIFLLQIFSIQAIIIKANLIDTSPISLLSAPRQQGSLS